MVSYSLGNRFLVLVAASAFCRRLVEGCYCCFLLDPLVEVPDL